MKFRIRESVTAKLVIALLIAVAAACIALAIAPGKAHAAPAVGCQDDLWWTLGSTRRTICDGPRLADGSWKRAREFYTPAHNVPLTCSTYGGSYYSTTSCSGGYWQERTSKGIEVYPVNDGNVLPDEPGWLPPTGTEVIR